MDDELSPSQAARRIGTTTRSVQRWIVSGRLPARRVGGRWRVASVALDAFIAGGADGGAAWNEAGGADHGSLASVDTPIRTLFIANRGEIVVRIKRTCDRLGIRAIAPTTDGPDGLDLLDIGAVVAAAQAAGAEAVHPGFGFLAENADFAAAVEAAGLRWVGPPAAAIQAMGDKAAARTLAARLGIPILPGYDGGDQSDRTLVAAVDRIGYPIVIKPSAGGGGKGMHVVRDPDRLVDALAAARREASAAFGDDRLVLERLAEGARHVEVQVLFDAHGHGVHLGERDCSLQRRHQKILEETPSPAVDPELRTRLTEAALALASQVGYQSAGTCEFLITDRGEPAFLEMNTRLQVEHPVTEAVTGRDLVADQLRIAAGETLDVAQGQIVWTGDAVEVRLYAEDAEDGFLPATGRIEALRWPAGDGIRVDAGIALGTDVGSRFDPMLAKVIAHGRDRAEAFDRLTRALDETVVLGVVTNLRFLRWLVRQPVVLAGEARTDTLDRIWPPDDWADRVAIPDDAWRTAATALAQTADTDPWAAGWRLNATPSVRLESGATTRSVYFQPVATAYEAVVVDDIAYLDLAGRSVAFCLAPPPDVDRAALAATRHTGPGGSAPVVAPMPGAVLAIHVAVGAAVVAGDPIVTLEAMKMEHAVVAPFDGRVTDLTVRLADQVTRGQILATIES
jgi:acetyl-CoA/propionyl-CoA carboxylase biotin carboxyl carrier protein